LHCNGMQMRAKRPHCFPFAFFGLRFTFSLRAGCCVDRLNPPRIEEMTPWEVRLGASERNPVDCVLAFSRPLEVSKDSALLSVEPTGAI